MLANAGEVTHLTLTNGSDLIRATSNSGNDTRYMRATCTTALRDELARRVLGNSGTPAFVTVADASPWGPILSLALPSVIGLLSMKYLLRSAMPESNDDEVNSGFRAISRRPDLNFDDVIVPTETRRDLEEVVDYIRNPNRFLAAGCLPIRGVLLHGPSGTGKTLLAKVVAAQAKAQFFPASGSQFVETYVGRGASRVRALLSRARNAAPAVVFIDELDSVGCRPGSAGGGPISGESSEYTHTLNELLARLDGVGEMQHDGSLKNALVRPLIVLGSTNRYSAIDPALMRPGRFDRHIFVGLPNAQARAQMLTVMLRKKGASAVLWADVSAGRADAVSSAELGSLAHSQVMDGFSGADVASAVNESAYASVREKRPIDMHILLRECTRVQKLVARRTESENERKAGGDASPWKRVLLGGG